MKAQARGPAMTIGTVVQTYKRTDDGSERKGVSTVGGDVSLRVSMREAQRMARYYLDACPDVVRVTVRATAFCMWCGGDGWTVRHGLRAECKRCPGEQDLVPEYEPFERRIVAEGGAA